MGLADIRREIDAVDAEIVRLFSERARLVERAGGLKDDEDAVRAPGRVEEVIHRVKQKAGENGLDPAIAERIYRTAVSCFVGRELREFRENKNPAAGRKVEIYREEDLPLHPDVPGAKLWAVGLEKSMLTYFELEPSTTFPVHSHEAEQITLVLEGELTFNCNGETVTLGPGDVAAIPSNAEHSAFTGSRPCRAVDAWSPPRDKFLEFGPVIRNYS